MGLKRKRKKKKNKSGFQRVHVKVAKDWTRHDVLQALWEQLTAHAANLSKVEERREMRREMQEELPDGFAMEFMTANLLEDSLVRPLVVPTAAILPKNRYMDILPVASTRVCLVPDVSTPPLTYSDSGTPQGRGRARRGSSDSDSDTTDTSGTSTTTDSSDTSATTEEEEEEEGSSSVEVTLPHPETYINANHVKLKSPHRYIVAQGPLPNTVGDFWRMVWQQGVRVIVMLTGLVENGIEKCDRYWPQLQWTLDTPLCSVYYASNVEEEHFTIRTFALMHAKTGEVRQVTQIHYDKWPDMAKPLAMGEFEDVFTACTEYQASFKDDVPMLVHCSAGVGRSGVFVAAHALVSQALVQSRQGETSPLSVRDTVLEMRKQRPYMVQTEEQYLFLYRFVLHKLASLAEDGASAHKKEGWSSTTESQSD